MAELPPKKGVAFTVLVVIRDADGDPVTTGTLSAVISKDAGAAVATTNTPVFVTTGNGLIYLSITATEMTADSVALIVNSTASGAKDAFALIYTSTVQISELPLASAYTAGRAAFLDNLDFATPTSWAANVKDGVLGRYVLDTVGMTLKVYKADNTTLLKTWTLTEATSTVPAYKERV